VNLEKSRPATGATVTGAMAFGGVATATGVTDDFASVGVAATGATC
jgi:hypothetical protein